MKNEPIESTRVHQSLSANWGSSSESVVDTKLEIHNVVIPTFILSTVVASDTVASNTSTLDSRLSQDLVSSSIQTN